MDEIDLSIWYNSLAFKEPTENMMRWMKSYLVPCKKICCHSTMCGVMRCSSCAKSLTTTFPPKTKYYCMICKIPVPTDDVETSGSSSKQDLQHESPIFCADCFLSDKIKHDHDVFCKVDSKGVHEKVYFLNILHTFYINITIYILNNN